jgi:hypothetical protein
MIDGCNLEQFTKRIYELQIECHLVQAINKYLS